MENMIQTGVAGASVPQKRVPVKKAPEVDEIETTIPGRGTTCPVRIGKLLEPVQQIINHPDRNWLIAALFKDYR